MDDTTVRWAKLLDAAAAYVTERSTRKRAVWERNWLREYDAQLNGAPTLAASLTPQTRDGEEA